MAFQIKNNAPTAVTTTVAGHEIRIAPRSVYPQRFAEEDMSGRLRMQLSRRILTRVDFIDKKSSSKAAPGATPKVNNVSEEDR